MSPLSTFADAADNTAALEKLQISFETKKLGKFDGLLTALFNPSTLQYSKDVTWKIAPITGQSTLAGYHQITFCAANPRVLTLELFFDTYEGEPESLTANAFLHRAHSGLTPLDPFNETPTGVSVATYTRNVANLAKVQAALHQPPLCQLWWGKQCLIQGVLTSLKEDFTMFLPTGVPVRAVLTCTFTEAIDPDAAPQRIQELESADILKRRVLKRGDTLSAIALEMYDDASRWRLIADANGIVDPRRLDPLIGTALIIPKLGR